MSEAKRSEFVSSVRGNLIVAKALAYAIDAIDSLPPEKQERSDRNDMCHVLTTVFGQWTDIVKQSVEHHTGRTLDLTDYKLPKLKSVRSWR
jgi:hypothetical protein